MTNSSTDYLISRFYNRTITKIEIGDVVKHINDKVTGKILGIGHNGVLVRRSSTGNEVVWPYSLIEFRFKTNGR